ncbi:DUF1214 domain-containing protein [Microbulbifer yueqingensis]|uniref:Uncharacterized conserved protein n=1 Tax=Microbulbifer yueqingensis TaxID=658219 RepID=A0A1G8UBX5_9GAMM|nr:DUF1214 domain-containing protein [Microbulbifer yueqingensis]SDJ51267.1 Uncharacterized conserved protein [Microbulbifer yueqingensis]
MVQHRLAALARKLLPAIACTVLALAATGLAGCGERDDGSAAGREEGRRAGKPAPDGKASDRAVLSDEELRELVTRSYQYVAMYNVNNKFAESHGGWNNCSADTGLKDHTMRDIARPNNDTLYISCMLDLRSDPVILEVPAFDSDYASLMITGYDHYVNIPLTTRAGNFARPQRILVYSARSDGYDGTPVEGVDHIFEATGDFVSAIFRVMPHSSEPQRFRNITEQMQAVRPITLSEYRGDAPKPVQPVDFPATGKTDVAVFGNNLLEVMQFVFNHTTFDPQNPLDQKLLSIYRSLGVEPGRDYDPKRVKKLDGERTREMARRVQQEWLKKMNNAELMQRLQPKMFQPKGKTDLETLVAVSIYGPIGVPREEAVYPTIDTADGEPMNAMHDYVVRMDKDSLPPAGAFWSVTLYDLESGFFIPNEGKKYSVGKNAGMKLNEQGGIDIYIAAKKPEGVPKENWLPIEREAVDLNLVMRIYDPDLEKLEQWSPPVAEKLPAE